LTRPTTAGSTSVGCTTGVARCVCFTAMAAKNTFGRTSGRFNRASELDVCAAIPTDLTPMPREDPQQATGVFQSGSAMTGFPLRNGSSRNRTLRGSESLSNASGGGGWYDLTPDPLAGLTIDLRAFVRTGETRCILNDVRDAGKHRKTTTLTGSRCTASDAGRLRRQPRR
jgi:hypothetical protein